MAKPTIGQVLKVLEKRNDYLSRADMKIHDLLGGKPQKLVLCTFATDQKGRRVSYKAMLTKSQCQRVRDGAPDADQIYDLLFELLAEFNVIANEAAALLGAALNP